MPGTPATAPEAPGGLRILALSDVYFPRVNGVSTSIRTFREELERLGHAMTVVAPAYATDDVPEPGIVRVPGWRVPFDPEDRLVPARRMRRVAASLPGPWDVVHVQTPFAAHTAGVAVARALAVPVVETYHTFFEQYLGHYIPLLPEALLARLARHITRAQTAAVDHLVVPSQPMAELLRGQGVATPMTVLPTGLRGDAIGAGDPVAFRRALGIGDERRVLVHVGRVAFEKNIGMLLHVLTRVRESVPEVLLVIAGEGPAKAELMRLASALELEDHVRFVGNLDRATGLGACYRAGEAFVFASRTETQGLVLLEAMALGVPVVSTAILGTRDLLDSGEGALVAEDDVDDFAACIVRLLRDPELRARLAVEGPRIAARWSAAAMARRMAKLYQEIVLPRPATAAAASGTDAPVAAPSPARRPA